MTNLITAERLRADGACTDAANWVEQHYPHGVRPTVAALLSAARAGLDITWLARYLSAPARHAFEEARVTAWHAFEEARAPAGRAYDEATATALAKAFEQGEA